MEALTKHNKSSGTRLMGKVSLARVGLLPVATAIMVLIFAISEPRFSTISNAQNIVFQAGVLALVSFGQLFPLLSGGIDFSVGSQIALASIVSAMLMVKLGIVIGIIGALAAVALVGFVIGLIVAKFKTNAMIVSLGMYWIINGLTLMISNGQNVYGLPKSFFLLGVFRIAGFPVAALWAVLAFILCYFILHLTTYGRQLYALGANEKTARLSGIPVDFARIMSYVICSLLAGFTGLVLTAALGSGQPALGAELSMQNFVVAFIAGTRWGGGEGSIVHVGFGVIFVAVLANGLNVLNVSSFAQMAVSGVILVIALALDTIRRRGLTYNPATWFQSRI